EKAKAEKPAEAEAKQLEADAADACTGAAVLAATYRDCLDQMQSDDGTDDDDTGLDSDVLTVQEVYAELKKIDPKLADRYLALRIATQRAERGEEIDPDGPPTIVTIGGPATTAADEWVANATMGDKWVIVCQDAVNDPNLVPGMKDAVAKLADPVVIAT